MQNLSQCKKETCKICGKQIVKLKTHMAIVHSSEKPFSCSYCEKSFKVPRNLRSHEKLHTASDNLYKCSKCEK